MALKLLRVLVVVVIAAAADDVPVTWSAGASATLPCVVPAAERVQSRRPPPPLAESPPPRSKPYQWWRRDDERDNSTTNGPFEVRRESGDGVYQCAVRHHGGLILGYPVHVKFAYMQKQFGFHPQNATAIIGQPFAIHCIISSAPPPTISWLKDEKILRDNDRYHVLSNQLLITDVSSSDSGSYRCIATNPKTHETHISDAGQLLVEPGVDQDAKFLNVSHESDVVVPRGSRVVLPCPVVGWPRPTLTWKFTPASGRTAELEATDEVLVLRRVELDQDGVYTCEIEETPLQKTFNVTVSEPPLITLSPVPREMPRASTVRFNCTAIGRPEPEITWYKDGQRLVYQVGGRINLRTSPDFKRIELVISGVISDDAGVYQCFAQNAAGVVSSWTTLTVTGADAEPPTGLQCWPESVREVRLRWARPPNTTTIVAYTVHIAPLDAKPGSLLPKLTNVEEEVSSGDPLTPYRFQVRGYIKNKNAASDLSEDVICQGQGVPIRLVKVGDDSVLVSWRHFANHTPGVVQWILQYRVDNTSEVHNVTLEGPVRNYTLSASPSNPLQVRLLGSKNLTWLEQDLSRVPWTSTSTAGSSSTIDLDDGRVTAVPAKFEVSQLGSRSFTVTWYCDDAEDHDKYYFLVCIRNEDGVNKCIESKHNSVTLEELQPGTTYDVRVQALAESRARAPGPFSAPYTVTTQSEGPQRFKDLSGQYVNSTTLRISWNGPPAKYRVHYSSELKLPVEQWDSIKTMHNSVLISDIDPTKNTYIMVIGYDPVENSNIKTILPLGAADLQYEYTRLGVRVTWRGAGPRVVSHSQNITVPVEQWPSVTVTEPTIELTGLNPSLDTYVMVTSSKERRSQVLTIKPKPQDDNSNSLLIGLSVGAVVLVICLVALAAVCFWRKRKRDRSPARRRRNAPAADGNEEEGSEMKNIGGRLANGGGSKDAGEPLLNGHVHITENPTSKTPNGKTKKSRLYEAAFDVSRPEDPDCTLETVLEADTSTTYNLLDTSRRPEFESRPSRDTSANNSFNKLPDDNMNSELTRSTDFQLDNSKIQPTLQPNG